MTLEANGIELYYEKQGKGPDLIMLHGNGETHSIFNTSIDVLKDYFTVYAIDTRGHGQSSLVNEYHYEDMAEDIYCFANQLELDRPILYGFSDGGIIGILLAIKYPELFEKIIISGVNTTPEGMKKGWLILFKIIYFFTRSAKFKLMISEPNISNDMLGKIVTPTYITAGDKDLISKEHIENVHNNISNSTLKIFENEDHGSYIINSDKIGKYIIEVCDINN